MGACHVLLNHWPCCVACRCLWVVASFCSHAYHCPVAGFLHPHPSCCCSSCCFLCLFCSSLHPSYFRWSELVPSAHAHGYGFCRHDLTSAAGHGCGSSPDCHHGQADHLCESCHHQSDQSLHHHESFCCFRLQRAKNPAAVVWMMCCYVHHNARCAHLRVLLRARCHDHLHCHAHHRCCVHGCVHCRARQLGHCHGRPRVHHGSGCGCSACHSHHHPGMHLRWPKLTWWLPPMRWLRVVRYCYHHWHPSRVLPLKPVAMTWETVQQPALASQNALPVCAVVLPQPRPLRRLPPPVGPPTAFPPTFSLWLRPQCHHQRWLGSGCGRHAAAALRGGGNGCDGPWRGLAPPLKASLG
mmetsp:Transcript_19675/g.38589  ORF Transcript_19675/g.38589 Transcript_19675/m.38589 type:complete len:354 (-) Transcript_19675:143-1204(-)